MCVVREEAAWCMIEDEEEDEKESMPVMSGGIKQGDGSGRSRRQT